ncbi:DsbA family protein [Galactobacter valiniphilus]|uniref:DsbA family protein n=1 Tax=Galactobacter valiniphilus TaxID=2676122 RepID=UPI00373568A2
MKKSWSMTALAAAAVLALTACGQGGVPGVPGLSSGGGATARSVSPPAPGGGVDPSGPPSLPSAGPVSPDGTPEAPGSQGTAGAAPIPAVGNRAGGVVLETPSIMAPTGGGHLTSAELQAAEDATSVAPGGARPRGVDSSGSPEQLIIYADLLCSHCADFQNTNAAAISQWLADKKVTVEYRLVSILPSGSAYPARAANALYCVADRDPASFLPAMKALYADQRDRSDEELASAIKQAGGPDVGECIARGTFRPYVAVSRGSMLMDGVPGTPAIFMNGEEFDGASFDEFKAWVEERF